MVESLDPGRSRNLNKVVNLIVVKSKKEENEPLVELLDIEES